MCTKLIRWGFLATVLGTVSFIGSSCFKEPGYSDTPAIQYVAISKTTLEAGTGVGAAKRDQVIVITNFQDGTGDMGEDTQDTTRLRQVFGKETWGNYEIRTFQYVNNKFEEVTLVENAKLYFPRLTREGQKGAIEGTLELAQDIPYTRPFRMVPVKFQVRIRDRGLRVSNTIETDTVSVPLSAR